MKQVALELFQQKRRMISIIGGLLLLNVGLILLVGMYLDPQVAASRATWSELRTQAAAAAKVDAATVYRRGTEDLKKFAARIPAKRQFPRVLGDILDAAASSSVVTGPVSYKPQVVKGQENLLAYGVSMSVGGTYAALKSFLSDVQKNGEMVVIDSITLAKSDLFEENVVMDIRLTVYLQGEEGA